MNVAAFCVTVLVIGQIAICSAMSLYLWCAFNINIYLSGPISSSLDYATIKTMKSFFDSRFFENDYMQVRHLCVNSAFTNLNDNLIFATMPQTQKIPILTTTFVSTYY